MKNICVADIISTMSLTLPASVAKASVRSEDGYAILKGNCLNILDQLQENSVDMVFADPPYNLSNDGFTCHAGKAVSVNKGKWDKSQGVEADFEFHKLWIQKCKRVLKPSGTIWISGTYHSIYACGFALQLAGYRLLNDIAWYKPNASPNLSCRFFTASHETILWARKDDKASHTFNYDAMRNGRFPGDVFKNDGKQMRSVWCISTPPPSEKQFGKHPTQKPVELLDRIVRASTNEGDLVLDPFMGSATTGIAAIANNRQFVGIELEQEFIDLALKRMDVEIRKQQKRLFLEEIDGAVRSARALATASR